MSNIVQIILYVEGLHPFVSSFAKLHITALTEGNTLSARKTTEATRFAEWSLLENHEDRGSAEQYQQAYDYGNNYSSSGSACSGGDRRHLAKFTMKFFPAIASQLIFFLLTPSAILATTYDGRWQGSLIGGIAMPLVIPNQMLKRIGVARAETAVAARNRYAEMTALVIVTRIS